jgi:hypothetical protein
MHMCDSDQVSNCDMLDFYRPQNMPSIASIAPDALEFIPELLPNDLITPRQMAMQ